MSRIRISARQSAVSEGWIAWFERLKYAARRVPEPQFDRRGHDELDAECAEERRAAARVREAEDALRALNLETLERYRLALLRAVAEAGRVDVTSVALANLVLLLAEIDVDLARSITNVVLAIERAERRGYCRGRADEVAARMADDDAP